MARTTTTLTFSLPPEMAERVDQLVEQEGRSRSELLREALRRYIDDCEWQRLLEYGERRARALGIGPEDVERLVDEYRAEVDAAQP
ncbi:MAG: ribbon-helix-helix protein, CopG family [Chloroflexi bacterium]|nr:ribbon-helix-helix protein, CopG family [Chloroflexota bacterium]